MHEMQSIVIDVRGVCPSVCQSVRHAAQLCGAFVQPLPNYFGLLLYFCVFAPKEGDDNNFVLLLF